MTGIFHQVCLWPVNKKEGYQQRLENCQSQEKILLLCDYILIAFESTEAHNQLI